MSLPDEAGLTWAALGGMVVVALGTFVTLFRVSAPYGRHTRAGWGPTISATLGWVLMEAPSAVVFAAWWWAASPERRFSAPGLVFLLLWELHYVHRAFVFPFRRRGGQACMPWSILSMGALFNVVNATLNARWLYALGPARDVGWFGDPRFWIGLLLFGVGYFINQQSDQILFNLRKPGETGYKIPHGGLYGLISCPNYFGELVAWLGFALLTWSPAAAVFVIWTAANLIPRAATHHRWYRARFPDYPATRRAILPWLY